MEKIIDKITKVMELASRGSTEAERDTAMLQAQKLLDKYNLSMSDIKSKKPGEKYTKGEDLWAATTSSLDERVASWIVGDFYNVQVIVIKTVDFERSIRIFGKKHNVEVASYMHPWIRSQMDNRWQNYKNENGLKGSKYRNTFIQGLYEGFHAKLTEQREELKKEYDGSTDLAVLDESSQILNWLMGDMNITESKAAAVKVKDYKVLSDGVVEGREINLHEQVGSNGN